VSTSTVELFMAIGASHTETNPFFVAEKKFEDEICTRIVMTSTSFHYLRLERQ
jgi:hypothetical protein